MGKCPMTVDELRILADNNLIDGCLADQFYELADWIQESEQQQSPWVRVEERLPEELKKQNSETTNLFLCDMDGWFEVLKWDRGVFVCPPFYIHTEVPIGWLDWTIPPPETESEEADD